MLLALDGPDGAGKSTLATELVTWARDRGDSARAISKWDVLDPARVPEARFLSGTDRCELRRCIAEMPSPARMMFLAWMNTMAAQRAAQATEDLVVIDGYWIKHAASELLMGCDPGLVAAITQAIAPVDLVVLVDVSPEVALRRKDGDLSPYECGTDPSCRPERFLSAQAAARAVMLDWARDDDWVVLPATDRDATRRTLQELVLPWLDDAPRGTDRR